jgi:hypothetical protein
MNKDQDNSPIRIEDLYPGHTPEWYTQAEDNIEAYLAVVVRVYERMSADQEALAQLRAALKSSEDVQSGEEESFM